MDYTYYVVPSIFLGYGSYKCYYYTKGLLLEYVKSKVDEKIESLTKKEEDEGMCKPFHVNSLVVKFSDRGETSSVYLPFRGNKSTTMLLKRFFLIKEDQKIELIQKPGIPFLVSASDLGGEKIIEEDLEGDIIKVYEKDEIPSL